MKILLYPLIVSTLFQFQQFLLNAFRGPINNTIHVVKPAHVVISINNTIHVVKPAHVVISIKQSPVLKGHLYLVLS